MEDLSLFIGLKDRDLKREGLIIGEGRYIAERLLASQLELLGLLCTPEQAASFRALAQERCPVTVMDHAVMVRTLGFKFHRGVLAAARRPEPLALETYLQNNPAASQLALLPAVSEQENIGSIIRSAAAFGLSAVATGPGCCDPLSRKAVRSAMGACFTLPLPAWEDDSAAIRALKHAGFHITGAVLALEAILLTHFRFPTRTALVLGHEAAGLPPAWSAACDALITIPVAPAVDSLNVGVAAGIFFHAWSGQTNSRPRE